MRRSRNSFVAVTLVALTMTAAASVRAHDGHSDIVDTAVSAGSFKTLAAALQAAGLVDALKSDGPFTVFAPTDDAFAKLPDGTLESLLKTENKEQLVGILTYHVVKGKVPAKQVVTINGATTLNGQRIDIKTDQGKVQVDDANVIKTDIACSNGIIHVIDNVILPVSDNIPTVAASAGSFNTLLAAAKAAGLVDALSGKGPFTVFAPTDDAFARLPEGTVETLLKPENKDKLADILKYHVVSGRVYSDAALEAKEAKTLQGQPIRISVSGDAAMINDARLEATDIDASNGVIHVIDSVLLPPDRAVSQKDAREMIERVVAQGSRMFNNGHHHQCAELYSNATRKMVSYGDAMPPQVMSTLQTALNKAQHTSCPTQRSWTLRHGLDRAYFAMKPSN